MEFFNVLFLLGISGFLPVANQNKITAGRFYPQEEAIAYGNHIFNRLQQTFTLMHFINQLSEEERNDVLDNLRFRDNSNNGKFPDGSKKPQFETQ